MIYFTLCCREIFFDGFYPVLLQFMLFVARPVLSRFTQSHHHHGHIDHDDSLLLVLETLWATITLVQIKHENTLKYFCLFREASCCEDTLEK